jgi:hypothetical protein
LELWFKNLIKRGDYGIGSLNVFWSDEPEISPLAKGIRKTLEIEDAQTVTLDGFKPETEYRVTVQLRYFDNSEAVEEWANKSAFSDISFTTPKAPPTGLTVTCSDIEANSAELTVKMNYAPGDYGTLLRVFLSEGSDEPDIDEAAHKVLEGFVDEQTVTLNKLKPNTTYSVKAVLNHYDAASGNTVSKISEAYVFTTSDGEVLPEELPTDLEVIAADTT